MYRQNANLSDRVDCQFENKFNDSASLMNMMDLDRQNRIWCKVNFWFLTVTA